MNVFKDRMSRRMRSKLIDSLRDEGVGPIRAGLMARRIEDADPEEMAGVVGGNTATTAAMVNGVYVYALAMAGCDAAERVVSGAVGGPLGDFFKGILDWLSDPANQEKIKRAIEFIMNVIVPLFL